jgi:hypothetical protein
VHVTLLSPPFTLVGFLAAESEFQQTPTSLVPSHGRPEPSVEPTKNEQEYP